MLISIRIEPIKLRKLTKNIIFVHWCKSVFYITVLAL